MKLQLLTLTQPVSFKSDTRFFQTWIREKLSASLAALLILLLIFSAEQSKAQGAWTPVATVAPHPNGGVMLLLSDGTVMAKTGSGGGSIGNLWDRLTPNASGSYANGTWTTLPAMIDTRLYFSSQVLKDGRVFVAGGEYGTGGAKGETYNPLTNSWTAAPASGHYFSDANSEILPDGRVLEALVEGSLTGTLIYNPVTNTWSNGPTCLGIHNESVWVKLPDNSILFVNRNTTSSERYIPASNQWVNDGTVPVALYDPYGLETGSAFLLPDGRAWFIGSPGTTAYYTPSGTTSPGTWAAGPTIPGGQGCPDAAAAMMVNGKILCAVSPAPSSFGVFQSPTAYYEFNYLTNTFTQIHAPSGGYTVNQPCYYTGMLDLPDGTVLYADQYSSQYYVYTPDGTPLAAGKPTISNITQNSCTSFTITGTQFNGISEGASYGDDWQMNTNYPIIRLTNGSNVYYARTLNWNSTGVRRGNLADTTQFTLPSGLPLATYSLVVTANGIASDPVSFFPAPTLSSTLTPPPVCSNTTFTYTPTSTLNGATFTWTRAAVTGISNAAITTPQSTNPNEVLVNTTSNPVSVIYAYTINAGGCGNTQNVTVVVNPTPVLSSTLTPAPICNNSAFTYTPTSATGGATYTWTRAAVAGISNAAVTTPQSTNPNEVLVNTTTNPVSVIYAYTITANNCSNNQQVTVVVNPPLTLSSTLTPAPICSNTAFTYTPTCAIGGATFTWTRAAVAGISNAAITTPQSTDPNEVLVNTTTNPVSVIYSYTIAANGCSNTVQVTVVVNPIPVLSSTLTPPAICGNGVFTYTPTSATGGATFTWTRAAVAGISNAAVTTPQSTNPNEALINTTTSPVSVVYAYTITANGCSNNQQVTVVVNPPITLSSTLTPGPVCSGNTFTYTPTCTIGSAVFTWTRAAVAGISNAAITTPQSTNPNEALVNTTTDPISVIYAYTISANGCTNNQDVTVIVNPLPTPTISGVSTICKGASTLLTANGGAGIIYQWIKGNGVIAGATDQTYTATKAGSYKVKETNSFSCYSFSAVITVTVLTSPAATVTALGDLDICAAGSVVLQANSGAGYTYQWQKGLNNLSGETNQTYTATTKGTYKVIVTASNGCSKVSTGTKVTKSCKQNDAAIAVTHAGLKIFPNPAEDQTTIHFTIAGSSHVCIKVYDVSGKEMGTVLNSDVEEGDYSLQLSTNHFSKGIYLVKMITDSGIENEKLIVE